MSSDIRFASDSSSLSRFTSVLSRRLGLNLRHEPESRLNKLLETRIRQTRSKNAHRYLALLEHPVHGASELRHLADVLAVSESYFFRNDAMFRAIAEHVLPTLDANRPQNEPLRLLSAGCAAGEEPYSLAMLIRELSFRDRRPVEIEAVDASEVLIEQALTGAYSSWSFRELSDERRRRWFREVSGKRWRIDPKLMEDVRFSVLNLMDTDHVFWSPGRFDLVLCRNVLIYMTPQASAQVVSQLIRSLSSGGFLFLGHAEALHGKRRGLEQRRSHGTFYYQRVPDLNRPARGDEPGGGASVFGGGGLVDSQPFRGFGAGHQGTSATSTSLESTPAPARSVSRTARSNRIPATASRPPRPTRSSATRSSGSIPAERLASGSPAPQLPSRSNRRARGTLPSSSTAQPSGMNGESFANVVRLVGEERSEEALAVAEEARDSDSRMLRIARASIHLMRGENGEACRLNHALLLEDQDDATTRFIDAFCRTSQGDHVGALRQFRAAAYLDPRFSLPHIQLGQHARRSGEREEAKQAFRVALQLLDEDHPWRITLLGGGFDAAGLARVCQRELRALEGIA